MGSILLDQIFINTSIVITGLIGVFFCYAVWKVFITSLIYLSTGIVRLLTEKYFIFGGKKEDLPSSDEELLEPKPLFTKLNPEAKIPTLAKYRDAGFDLYSLTETVLKAGELKVFETGVSSHFRADVVGKIFDRSSMGAKGILVLGGVVDSVYTGEIKVILKNLSNQDIEIKKHDRIAQMVLLKLAEEVAFEDPVSEQDRGENGFGSSGQ